MPEFERQSRTQNSRLASAARRGRAMIQLASPAAALLSQQQALGNQAMQRFAQSCPLRLTGPTVCPFGGACHACPPRAQAKLKIGQPGDRYEREADQVADMIMRVSHAHREDEATHVKGLCLGRKGKPNQEPPEKFEGDSVPRKRCPPFTPKAPSDVSIQIKSLRGKGQPLPGSVRDFFETQLGHDFTGVRIHTDKRFSETARQMNARAFTLGQHVVFAPGQYAPGASQGKRLLAHEMVHVMQQSEGRYRGDELGNRGFATIVQRTEYSDNCWEAQLSSLMAAAFKAYTETVGASSELADGVPSQAVRNALWLAFRDESQATADRVRGNLEDIAEGLLDATIDCEQANELLYSFGCGGDREAYTYEGWQRSLDDNIHICMGAWPSLNGNRRSRIIVHECSHLFNNTTDDGGYFESSGCAETSDTVRHPSATRLTNADSYACFVHYVASTPASRLSEWVADLSGASPIRIRQAPPGEINLDNGPEDRPTFGIWKETSEGLEPFLNPVVEYQWSITDAANNRHQMREIGQGDAAEIPGDTWALLRAWTVRTATVRCGVTIPATSTRQLSLPIHFTSAAWG